jgi:hypothetical protein
VSHVLVAHGEQDNAKPVGGQRGARETGGSNGRLRPPPIPPESLTQDGARFQPPEKKHQVGGELLQDILAREQEHVVPRLAQSLLERSTVHNTSSSE